MTRLEWSSIVSTPLCETCHRGRPQQKAEFGCEFFPNVVEAGSGEYFIEFFQRDRDGQRKGIITINLEAFEP